ncbi:MAG: hypothetical protein ACMXYK_01460 [Candidatus Woesearchaeota archaeon]
MRSQYFKATLEDRTRLKDVLHATGVVPLRSTVYRELHPHHIGVANQIRDTYDAIVLDSLRETIDINNPHYYITKEDVAAYKKVLVNRAEELSSRDTSVWKFYTQSALGIIGSTASTSEVTLPKKVFIEKIKECMLNYVDSLPLSEENSLQNQ